jgi:aryl sulfotransferase
MTAPARPVRDRVYRNAYLDSRRWDHVPLRGDDIIISTSYKAGTTWTQRIVSLLLFGPGKLRLPLGELSPWVDARFRGPVAPVAEALAAQRHRRFLKSHLPLDALPYDERIKYVFVGRDGRDVFMSWWNHQSSYTDAAYELLNSGEDFAGEPQARLPDDIHEFFDDWIHRASVPWEQDGWPLWSHFYHAQSFWRFRQLPNLHFVHYADLTADREAEMRRLAAFLGIAVDERDWPALVAAASFDAMKAEAVASDDELLAAGTPRPTIFREGARSFFHKGTNGRWRDVLTPTELGEYEKATTRALTPDCAAWLERGRAAYEPKAG